MTTETRPRAATRLWPGGGTLIGMVHLLPLPGAPGWRGSMDEVLDRAAEDATALRTGGMDAVLVENYEDVPFLRRRVAPETVAAMARVVAALVSSSRLPVGVNVLRNDARAALGIAAACGASFMRVNVHTGTMWTDQGRITGTAADTLRARAALGADVAILGDVHVKHATPPPGERLEAAAADAWYRGLADGLIVTGGATGEATALDDVRRVRAAVPDAVVFVGSGVDADSVGRTLSMAHGVIVGSALTREGRAGSGIDEARVRALVAAARGRA